MTDDPVAKILAAEWTEAFDRRAAERAAVENGITIYDEMVEAANNILNFLVPWAKKEPDWKTIIHATMDDDKIEATIRTVEQRLQSFHLEEAVGGIAHGTATIKDHLGIGGELGQHALWLLKVTGRLVQGGTGRGRCMIVLSNEGLVAENFARTRAAAAIQPAGELDAFTLLRMLESRLTEDAQEQDIMLEAKIREAQAEALAEVQEEMVKAQETTATLKRKLEELEAERLRDKRSLAELQHACDLKDAAIKQLEKSLAERTVATWM
jgi:hypothetical protein